MKQLSQPAFTVTVAASLVGVSPRTLRNWEAHGLIAPFRQGRSRRRLYSWSDVEQLQRIRYLVSRRRVPLRAVKPMLRAAAVRPASPPVSRHGGRGAPVAAVPLAVPLPRRNQGLGIRD